MSFRLVINGIVAFGLSRSADDKLDSGATCMASATQTPNLEWYTAISEKKHLNSPRCPFASVDRCPRYYQSLSLLGTAGATSIEPKEDERLLKKWEAHDLWPKTMEQSTTVMGSGGKTTIFSRFCPEVSHEAFGVFASFMSRYADEIDSDLAYQRLGREGASRDDWRWSWAELTPAHYSDCPLYSTLLGEKTETRMKDHQPKPAQAGFVDTLIIILVSAALVIFLLWAASRATGLEAFEHLPSWLQDSYKAIWSSVAAGTAGFGLAVFKFLTRKQNDRHPNYLLLIGITTGCLLVAIFLLLQMFKAQAKVPPKQPPSDPVNPAPTWHNEDPSGNPYVDSFNMDPNCTQHPERITTTHRCSFDHTQISEPGDGTPYDTWHLYIDAPGPITEIVCEPTGSHEIKARGIKEGNTAECTGEINGNDGEIRFNVKYQQLW